MNRYAYDMANYTEEGRIKVENADISNLNWVFVLEDGMKVIITSIEENSVNDTRNTNIITGYEENVISGSNSKVENVLININTASQEKLESLLGIGFAITLRIISYREKNGFFFC